MCMYVDAFGSRVFDLHFLFAMCCVGSVLVCVFVCLCTGEKGIVAMARNIAFSNTGSGFRSSALKATISNELTA